MDRERAKQVVRDAVDELAPALLAASHDIHAHPELCFEEHHAHRVLTELVADAGLAVTRGAYGLPTAFESRSGGEGPNIAVLCEYDALPGIGHACGHNIIATAGLGAGLAAARVAEELGGRVTILGTPAEEGGGGKVFMIERGAFDGIDAALMVHPADADLVEMTTIAIQQVEVRYEGRAAHAAAAPERGLNALDAAVLGYVNVAALRQHIAPNERIHGVFLEAGEKANIVPERASANWYIRSGTLRSLEPLKQRVAACLEAGALAAGCVVELEWIDPAYADLVPSDALSAAYAANAQILGRPMVDDPDRAVVGSTDMGNVSYAVPAIHPMIQVAPRGVAIHTPEFATHAGGPEGDRAVVDGAKLMAMTIVDCWTDPDVLDRARSEHRTRVRDH